MAVPDRWLLQEFRLRPTLIMTFLLHQVCCHSVYAPIVLSLPPSSQHLVITVRATLYANLSQDPQLNSTVIMLHVTLPHEESF
jgi:hypothetical protein